MIEREGLQLSGSETDWVLWAGCSAEGTAVEADSVRVVGGIEGELEITGAENWRQYHSFMTLILGLLLYISLLTNVIASDFPIIKSGFYGAIS